MNLMFNVMFNVLALRICLHMLVSLKNSQIGQPRLVQIESKWSWFFIVSLLIKYVYVSCVLPVFCDTTDHSYILGSTWKLFTEFGLIWMAQMRESYDWICWEIEAKQNFLMNCVTCPYCFAAPAAKSLHLCPTLCDPIGHSPQGSPVPGILQARTLKWVAVSFSNAWKWKVKVKSLSCVWLVVTPWTAAYQAPPSMGFSRQEYWSGLPLPSPYCYAKYPL